MDATCCLRLLASVAGYMILLYMPKDNILPNFNAN